MGTLLQSYRTVSPRCYVVIVIRSLTRDTRNSGENPHLTIKVVVEVRSQKWTYWQYSDSWTWD